MGCVLTGGLPAWVHCVLHVDAFLLERRLDFLTLLIDDHCYPHQTTIGMHSCGSLEHVGAECLNVLGCHPHFSLTEYRIFTIDNVLHRLGGFDQDGEDTVVVLLLLPVRMFSFLVFRLLGESWGGIL